MPELVHHKSYIYLFFQNPVIVFSAVRIFYNYALKQLKQFFSNQQIFGGYGDTHFSLYNNSQAPQK